MRYFLLVYDFRIKYNAGVGNLRVIGANFPNNDECRRVAAAASGCSISDVVIINIIEFKNEQDYNDFVK